MANWYVSQKSGIDTNDGTSESTAALTFNYGVSLTTSGDQLNILGGEFNETLNLANKGLIVNMLHRTIISGVTEGVRIQNYIGGNNRQLYDATIKNCTYAIYHFGDRNAEYHRCKIEGDIYGAFNAFNIFELYYCELLNGSYLPTTTMYITHCENTSFYSYNDIYIDSQNPFIENILKDSTITIAGTDDITDVSVFDNVQFRFSASTSWVSITTSYETCNSLAELRVKRDSDLGLTAGTSEAVNWGANLEFDTIDYNDPSNNNLSLASKDLYQYSTEYPYSSPIGSNPYSIYIDSTQMNPDSNSSISSGYAIRTSPNESEIICDAIEFDKSQIIKRIYAIIDIGTGGEIMSSQIEDANRRIIDVDLSVSATKTASQLDSNPENYNNYKIGIIDNAFNYDEINEVAKSCKVKFTIKNEGSSPDFGEVRVHQIIIETTSLNFIENYNVKQYGGGNGYYLSRSGKSAYKEDINPTGNATLQDAINATGIVPHNTSIFSAIDLEELAASPSWQRVYLNTSNPDDLNTNMTNLVSGDLEIYTNNAPKQTLVNGTIRTITSLGSGKVINFIPIPCSNWGVKLLKFKNLQGGVEYLFFYQKDSKKSNTSDSSYLQFEDGYKNVNGDTQREFTLWRDDLPRELSQTVEALDNNQNVWFADDWQICDVSKICEYVDSPSLPLESNERLVKIDLTAQEYKEIFKRFDVGERVTFITDSGELDMHGVVAQYSNGEDKSMLIKFTGTAGNDDLATLDTWIASSTELYLTAFDAWELCTVSNLTKYETKRDKLFVQVGLVTQPEKNYKI